MDSLDPNARPSPVASNVLTRPQADIVSALMFSTGSFRCAHEAEGAAKPGAVSLPLKAMSLEGYRELALNRAFQWSPWKLALQRRICDAFFHARSHEPRPRRWFFAIPTSSPEPPPSTP